MHDLPNDGDFSASATIAEYTFVETYNRSGLERMALKQDP